MAQNGPERVTEGAQQGTAVRARLATKRHEPGQGSPVRGLGPFVAVLGRFGSVWPRFGPFREGSPLWYRLHRGLLERVSGPKIRI